MEISSPSPSIRTLFTSTTASRATFPTIPAKKKATFSLNSGLDSDKTYTATVTTAVKDNSGNTLASDYSWNFTTEDEGGCFIKIVD